MKTSCRLLFVLKARNVDIVISTSTSICLKILFTLWFVTVQSASSSTSHIKTIIQSCCRVEVPCTRLAFQQPDLISRFISQTSKRRINNDRYRFFNNVDFVPIRMGRNDNGDSGSDNSENKFNMIQRIDSGKSFVVGAIVGSIAMAPVVAIHDLVFFAAESSYGSLAQFEYDSDSAAIVGGLFSVVYRYCIRTDTSNEQLQQGVVGAFAITRTVSRITIPQYCTAIPLNCGQPLGILDWNVLQQLFFNGIESVVLFGSVAVAIEVLTNRGDISRFPG